ncbi:MAG: hypothetical protein CVV64_15575 [Candidatus Wallbacteria bacterium HGW-Wallbacteria-1]|jgi:hypothetical protein|uniref:Uncharacterized protein n=1 Tax=Candidatus Wallbacteria bacterium HGW-Wallbacteria-1 TaxID=2013854 RepID=A0A2N1PLL9_9BACT|nr:MAG: hypothetical protein CVV64_15575 [Candidatus Wallbacteria bacterium HGW-Wallbacteria-1]
MKPDKARFWLAAVCLMNVFCIAAHLVVSIKKPGADPIFRSELIMYLPWPFFGNIAVRELIAVSVLTILLFFKSRIAAVLLLILFILTRVFILVFAMKLNPLGTSLTALWTFMTIQGTRAAFALNRK